MTLMQILNNGGLSLYPLIIFSIIIWGIAIERIYFLCTFSKQYKKLYTDLTGVLQKNNLLEATGLLKTVSESISAPHEVLFISKDANREDAVNKMYRRLTETQAELKKGVWILGTIATSAPFVGLFGTVLGIMESFQAIGESGKSGFSIVAAGISESLIATALGILVAVIAVIFYNIFQTMINRINLDFKNKLEEVAELIFSSQTSGK